ncbi:MAG: hypothetical protein ACP5PS_01005 [Bacteroidales bacterium]
MMKINTDNYIEIFIHYFDGQLTAEESVELMQFIAQHPHLQKEFEQMQTVFLKPSEAEKVNFTHLLKDINQRNEVNEYNFEELCIAELEGDLHNAVLRRQLYQWINAHENNQKIFALYKQTKTHPDEKIIFPHKKILKKPEKSVTLPWVFRSIAVAASVTLVVGLGRWWIAQSPNQQLSTENISAVSLPVATTPPIQTREKQKFASQKNTTLAKKIPYEPSISKALPDSSRINVPITDTQVALNELSPRLALAETHIPYRNFIIIDEKFIYPDYQNTPDNKPYLTMGEWINGQVTKWKKTIFNLPAEHPLAHMAEANVEQMSLLLGNHVIFRQNTDTLNGRKRVEVNLGWVALYFSYNEK